MERHCPVEGCEERAEILVHCDADNQQRRDTADFVYIRVPEREKGNMIFPTND